MPVSLRLLTLVPSRAPSPWGVEMPLPCSEVSLKLAMTLSLDVRLNRISGRRWRCLRAREHTKTCWEPRCKGTDSPCCSRGECSELICFHLLWT